MKTDPRYHDGSAMLGLVMTLILTSLAVWLVLSVQRAFAETKANEVWVHGTCTKDTPCEPVLAQPDCFSRNGNLYCKQIDGYALTNDMNWAEAIRIAEAKWEKDIAESRKREDLLLKEVKLLNYQIDTLSKAVLDK